MKQRCLFLCLLVIPLGAVAQERVEQIPFGDMEQWAVRIIKESKLLGGASKEIYALGPADTLVGNQPYDFGQTLWGISNAYANVVGVAKAAASAYPEPRDNGYCVRLDARMETVTVIGLVNIRVAIAGALFLGEVFEPVRSANDPYGSVSYGISFTGRPKALLFDVKTQVSPENTLTKALGWGVSEVEGHDEPQVYLFLQQRWEDDEGNIFARRVGTAYVRFAQSVPQWHNDYRMDIIYGEDLSGLPNLEAYRQWEAERDTYRCLNSRGQLKEVREVGFASDGEAATHLMVMFSAGCHSAFYAHLGNSIWIDNVRLAY